MTALPPLSRGEVAQRLLKMALAADSGLLVNGLARTYPGRDFGEACAVYSDDLRQAADALEALGVETWQPIETAPKDGTQILAYSKRFGRHIVEWDVGEEAWFPASGLSLVMWHPLPEKPLDPNPPEGVVFPNRSETSGGKT